MSDQNPAALQPAGPAQMTFEDQKLWATLVHVGGIIVGFWASLIGYLVTKDRGVFVREHCRAALNFMISWTIYGIAASVGMLVVTVITFGVGLLLMVPLILGISITSVVFMIIAATKANAGEYYSYPLTITFISR